MSFEVYLTKRFQKEAKRLAKKYPSFKKDLRQFSVLLSEEPSGGTFLGQNCYKSRLAISSKGKGKSGGARIITYFRPPEGPVILLSIYDKSEKESINNSELGQLIALANEFLDELSGPQ